MNPSQRGGPNGLADSAEVSRMDDISAADANEEEGKQGGANANLGAQIAKPQVSSKHWRKIRTAVVALAAFRRQRVKAADFERIKLFGEGGSGLVYLVKLKNTSMYFALKVQRKLDLQAKEKRIRRALIEREVLVACAHPFVCSLYTAFQDSRHLYLLMDFCAGGDLTSLIRNVVRRPLREDEARFYVSEIVAALEWVHLHGYVYRDLKPENVLIHESGHIRLGDFGTAERGSVKCTRPMSERLGQVEIERELLASSNRTLTTAAATAGGAMEAMAKADGPEAVIEDEYDDGASDEDLGNTLRGNSIVVDIDPLLEESNASHVRSKTNDVYPSAFAPGPSRNDDDPAVESPSPDGTGTFPFKCCPSRQKGGSRTTEAATVAPAPIMPEFVQKFSRGRGSVKLNVLLDSQTFIGTADFMAPEMVTGKNRQGTAMDWWALGVMLFEMTLGTLPFNSNLEQSSNGVFRSIVNAEIVFPRRHKLSRAAVNLIKELLRKDPAQRLGERKGVGEIKRHAFFANTHWALLAHVTPPFKVPGPDTPGWITSITSAPSRNRHDKMATWTWNVTDEGSRPPETVVNPAAFEMARNILDQDSISDDSSQRITESLERGEDVKTPAGLPKALAASGGGKMTWSKTPKGGNDDGVPSSGAGELYLSEDSTHTAGVSYQTEGGDMNEVAGGSAPRYGSSQAVSLNGSETMHKEEIEYASTAVLTSAYSRAKVMTAENSNGSSFDGYDFNTVRKRGSFTDGKSNQGMPTLSANKSSEY